MGAVIMAVTTLPILLLGVYLAELHVIKDGSETAGTVSKPNQY